MRITRSFSFAILILFVSYTDVTGQTTSITEEVRSIPTYPYSEPNEVPLLVKDARLYPYHSFEGYSHDAVPQDWKVIKLENEYIEVYVLPQAGGKVWGAIEKKTGKEFIYRNEVMKFRNIALRGPWTSGGIEFNFGVIGHSPSTASPVDYLLKENEDGSVSCFVGAMDLPSRTNWRVEIRLEPGRSNFETNVYWSNPTSLEQPYYNWLTAAAFARNDLVMSIPGNQFLRHSGQAFSWPMDDSGRFLAAYQNNRFEGHKSYHVVGHYNDFFGGYYGSENWGFGHWARYEDAPGQKLWLWALSRQGGVWDNLLTDTDGQYVEYQAGRMFVQYSPGSNQNPITKAGFPPHAVDQWSESWFPVMGTGGLSDVSKDGVLSVDASTDRLKVKLNTFKAATGTIIVKTAQGTEIEVPYDVQPLELWERAVPVPTDGVITVLAPELDLEWSTDQADRLALSRSFELEESARPSLSENEIAIFEARELMKARYYAAARDMLEKVESQEPWNRDALVHLAELDLREARYGSGLTRVQKALQLNTSDAKANFVAGALYVELGRDLDARDAFSWAARSMEFRSAANARIAEIELWTGRLGEALEFAARSLDFNRYNTNALEIRAISSRLSGGTATAQEVIDVLVSQDPLNHFARAEKFLATNADRDWGLFASAIRSEFPDQTVLELAIRYASLGLAQDAVTLLSNWRLSANDPMLLLWEAYLTDDPSLIIQAANTMDTRFSKPYRPESIPVLAWVVSKHGHWAWAYLAGLNLWAVNRGADALPIWDQLQSASDQAGFYVARATLASLLSGRDQEPDLLQATNAPDASRLTHLYLIRYFQKQERWQDALDLTESTQLQYPGDFTLQLLRSKTLLYVDRAGDAAGILENIKVLPSEGAREAHTLFEAAYLSLAIDALEAGDYGAARFSINRAREWPEHLGQGKPYEPDERLARYLLSIVDVAQGDLASALPHQEYVVEQMYSRFESPSRLHELAVDVRRRQGRTQDADNLEKEISDKNRALLDVPATITKILVDRALLLSAK